MIFKGWGVGSNSFSAGTTLLSFLLLNELISK